MSNDDIVNCSKSTNKFKILPNFSKLVFVDFLIDLVDFHTTSQNVNYLAISSLLQILKNPNIDRDTAISKVARLMGHPVQKEYFCLLKPNLLLSCNSVVLKFSSLQLKKSRITGM